MFFVKFNENGFISEFVDEETDGYVAVPNLNCRFVNGNIVDETEFVIKQEQIAKLRSNLSNTDYVANKISEEIATSFITGDNSGVIALRNKYFNILADRDAWREEINRLEEELNNGNIQWLWVRD